ncbi:MAG: hypothetical protein ACI865_001737 [Flavobacteriaceae bacterium]|jgi:hypothetical protein
MIFNSLVASLFIFTVLPSQAQDWSSDTYIYGKQYVGYVIDTDGERIDGFIKYRNRAIMQEEVIFYREKDNTSTKKKYLVADLKEYKVADKLYHCIPYSGNSGGQSVRGNLVMDDAGCIKSYKWYTMASGYKSMKKRPDESSEDYGKRKFPAQKVYFKSTDGIGVTKAFFDDGFNKKMAEYVADNKELSKKVKSKASGYDARGFMKIIKEFNEGCN